MSELEGKEVRYGPQLNFNLGSGIHFRVAGTQYSGLPAADGTPHPIPCTNRFNPQLISPLYIPSTDFIPSRPIHKNGNPAWSNVRPARSTNSLAKRRKAYWNTSARPSSTKACCICRVQIPLIRSFAQTNRNPQVLRSMQALYGNGRLANTGYVSILPVDQGIQHSAGASFTQPRLLRSREHR